MPEYKEQNYQHPCSEKRKKERKKRQHKTGNKLKLRKLSHLYQGWPKLHKMGTTINELQMFESQYIYFHYHVHVLLQKFYIDIKNE